MVHEEYRSEFQSQINELQSQINTLALQNNELQSQINTLALQNNTLKAYVENQNISKEIAKEILVQSQSMQQRIDQFIFDAKIDIKNKNI